MRVSLTILGGAWPSSLWVIDSFQAIAAPLGRYVLVHFHEPVSLGSKCSLDLAHRSQLELDDGRIDICVANDDEGLDPFGGDSIAPALEHLLFFAIPVKLSTPPDVVFVEHELGDLLPDHG